MHPSPSPNDLGLDLTLDRVLPVYDLVERHATKVSAPPDVVLSAARAVTPRDAPLLRWLFRLRGLPVLDAPIWETMRHVGFGVAGEEALAAVGRPWTIGGGQRQVEAPATFDEPGYGHGVRVRCARRRALDRDTRAVDRLRGPATVPRLLVRRSGLAAARRRAEAE